jgi:hypothetical protein
MPHTGSHPAPRARGPAPQLRKALEEVLARPGAVVPEKARFFRGQMQTIISKALGDVGIKPLPSRRCFSIMSEHTAGCGRTGARPKRARARSSLALAQQQAQGASPQPPPPSTYALPAHPCSTAPPLQPLCPARVAALLEERLENVYKPDARYSDKAATLFNLDLGAPEVGLPAGGAQPLALAPNLLVLRGAASSLGSGGGAVRPVGSHNNPSLKPRAARRRLLR